MEKEWTQKVSDRVEGWILPPSQLFCNTIWVPRCLFLLRIPEAVLLFCCFHDFWSWFSLPITSVCEKVIFLFLIAILKKKVTVLVTQSCLTLCDPIYCSMPDSSVRGILQARILEWVAIPFSRGSSLNQGSNPGLLHCRQILYCLSYQGSPYSNTVY